MFKSSIEVFEDALEQACSQDIKQVVDIINLWAKTFGLMLQYAKVQHPNSVDVIIKCYIDYLVKILERGEIKIYGDEFIVLDWESQLKYP